MSDKQGDQYAKRLLVHKMEQNQTLESKNHERRRKILEVIRNGKVTSPAHARHGFQPEFLAGAEEEQSFVSTWPDAGSLTDGPSFCAKLAPAEHSLSPSNRYVDDARTDQHRRDFLSGMLQEDRKSAVGEWLAGTPSRERVSNLQKVSLGEYFGAKSDEDMRTKDFLGKTCEEEFEQFNADVIAMNTEQIFSPRVLEVLEPEVVAVDRKSFSQRRMSVDLMQVRKTLTEASRLLQQKVDLDSTVASLVSEDIRELDREIKKLELHEIPETPKRMYPSLSPMKRMSEKFTPKKLFHRNINDEVGSPGIGSQIEKPKFVFRGPRTVKSPESDTYSTPMPITNSQMNELNRSPQNGSFSFLRGNTSSFLDHLPKLMRNRKPNMESTRKIYSSGGNPLSPSSQVGTSISTLTLPNTPSSPHTVEEKTQSPQHASAERDEQGSSLPYEVQNFLKVALGDEHCYSTVTYTNAENMRNRTDSCFTASELISEDRTPPRCKVSRELAVPQSEPPKRTRTALNRSLTIYRTFTSSIKKKFKKTHKDQPDAAQKGAVPYDLNPCIMDDVKRLLDQLEVHQTQIYQASKALDLCASMREFQASSERVELERLLVIASIGKKAISDAIRRLTSRAPAKRLYREKGELIVEEMSLQLREDMLRREYNGGGVIEWFVVVFSEGLTVWATHAIACPTNSGSIKFPGKLVLPALSPDFRLQVSVFSMKLQPIIYHHEDKYHIGDRRSSNVHKSGVCPSPEGLLHRGQSTRKAVISPKQYEIRCSSIKQSAFVLCGSLELVLHDLSLSSPWPLCGVPSDSVLHGTIDLSLRCKLQLSVAHAGFLTLGDEPGGLIAWSRRWCVLDGRNLLFWNYPREQECKPPLFDIDLVNCVSSRIALVDRTMCARPRTLLVETARQRSPTDEDSLVMECRSSCTVVKNLLSCDTHQDLVEWQSKLNHVITALREWNVIDSKSSLPMSDL